MPSKNSYYDIDAILAEEELIPCAPQFNFSYLSHLDPDQVVGSNKKKTQHYLPEMTRIKMPLWAVEKWAVLGYVRLSLPRHFGRKARERLEADPSEVDLSKSNERYFLSGQRLINLLEKHTTQVKAALRRSSSSVKNVNKQMESLIKVEQEAKELRKTLLSTFTGTRLSHTLNWALSSVDDDVTAYTSKLTRLELRLFHSGATAAAQQAAWKVFGMPPQRLPPRQDPITTSSSNNNNNSRAVTPDPDGNESQHNKRRRTS